MLVLGDGDFSFTRALARMHPNTTVVATELGSTADLCRRYGNATERLRELLALGNVQVILGVDATALHVRHESQLAGAENTSSGLTQLVSISEVGEITTRPAEAGWPRRRQFGKAIFNYPHRSTARHPTPPPPIPTAPLATMCPLAHKPPLAAMGGAARRIW